MRDNCSDPFIYLREQLRSLGYELVTSDDYNVEGCEWIFFFNVPNVSAAQRLRGFLNLGRKRRARNLYAEAVAAGLEDQLALFLWEPPSTYPMNWDAKLHGAFRVIFTWHDAFVDGRKYFKVLWPQPSLFPPVSRMPFREKKLLVTISMNKRSRHPRELYSTRRGSIRYFETTHPDQFDLFGVGWNQPSTWYEKAFPFAVPHFPSYRGSVANKWEILPRYRFALCYENVSDQPGYITEKIFDCMRSDCVPVYWGAPNVTDYVDPDALIDRRTFESDSDLERFLLAIDEVRYERYREVIASYLGSDRFRVFLPPAFASAVIAALDIGEVAHRSPRGQR
jgi:hypothetical protein